MQFAFRRTRPYETLKRDWGTETPSFHERRTRNGMSNEFELKPTSFCRNAPRYVTAFQNAVSIDASSPSRTVMSFSSVQYPTARTFPVVAASAAFLNHSDSFSRELRRFSPRPCSFWASRIRAGTFRLPRAEAVPSLCRNTREVFRSPCQLPLPICAAISSALDMNSFGFAFIEAIRSAERFFQLSPAPIQPHARRAMSASSACSPIIDSKSEG